MKAPQAARAAANVAASVTEMGHVLLCLVAGLLPAIAANAAGAGMGAAAPGASPAARHADTQAETYPGADARLREITYDPHAVVTVPVKRGTVLLVLLDADEAIAEIAAGLGGDCTKPDAAWCIAAQPGGRSVFIKPKSSASAPNILAIVTNRRIHNLRLQVLADGDPRPPLYRLVVRAPVPERWTPGRSTAQAEARLKDDAQEPSPTGQSLQVLRQVEASLQALVAASSTSPISPAQQVSERLQAKPRTLNTHYAMAAGDRSEDIVPTLVFDDGRFTYLRLPGNREMPAVFQVLGDGSEAQVNARVEDDLLVVDRVTRRLVLRAGTAVVGLWNEAFDIEGLPPQHGTTVPGVRRALRSAQTSEPSPPELPVLTPGPAQPQRRPTVGSDPRSSADLSPDHSLNGGAR